MEQESTNSIVVHRDKLIGDYYDCVWDYIPDTAPTFDVDESDYEEWWEDGEEKGGEVST